ncbi:MFS transporter [Streptomyces sp. NPDC048337]|uniref:MFS transporter n=1 Tax=Streptomyces sp. NPDC048337 TaxID=3365535 RepID=UPI00372081AA
MPGPLRRNKDFTVFWLGQALSVLGGSISLLALPLLVMQATGSLVQMGILTVVSGATGIGTGMFAGYVVDRVDRRRLMIVCDLTRAVLLGAVPFLWWAGGPRIWLLYVLTALTALRTLFDVAYVTAVPNLVRTEDLTAANGRLMGTFALGTLLGPAAAGLLAASVGPTWAGAWTGPPSWSPPSAWGGCASPGPPAPPPTGRGRRAGRGCSARCSSSGSASCGPIRCCGR